MDIQTSNQEEFNKLHPSMKDYLFAGMDTNRYASSLVTEKNRKVRMVKELYPEINIKLLYRKDFHRILAKYGFGPLADADVKGIGSILLSARQIQNKVNRLGGEISKDYKGMKPVLVGVQRGMICFMADLMRKISLPVEIDFMTISPYSGDNTQSVDISKDFDSNLILKKYILKNGIPEKMVHKENLNHKIIL